MSRRSTLLVGRLYYQIGILTVITSVVWVIFGIYRAVITVPSVNVDQSLLAPITPTINADTVTALTRRLQLASTAPELASSFAATPSATTNPTPIPTPAPTATPIATGSATTTP